MTELSKMQGKRILLIDDDQINLQLLCSFFSRLGFEVLTSTSGKQAISAYRGRPTDVVVTDIFMPDIDGLELLRNLQGINPHVKVFTMSAVHASKNFDHLAIAEQMGALKSFSKPVNPQDLLTHIQISLA